MESCFALSPTCCCRGSKTTASLAREDVNVLSTLNPRCRHSRRCRVVTAARSQNFAYLNLKAGQQRSAAASATRRTTKVVPELSNLLPFLSAWGALMLSEGAGLPEWLVLLNLTWGAGASVAAGIVLEKYKLESKPIQMRLEQPPLGVRRGGKLPLKELVKAADGSVEGLKQLLKHEWGLPEDANTSVFGIDVDGGEFEFTPMVAHDLTGTLSGAQAVLLRVMPVQHGASGNGVTTHHVSRGHTAHRIANSQN